MQRNSYCSLKAPSFFSIFQFPLAWVVHHLPPRGKSASDTNLAARMATSRADQTSGTSSN